MSVKIKDLLGKRSFKGSIGIEVEVVAGNPLPVEVKKPWVAHPDNSLRSPIGQAGCMEYVTNVPIACDDTKLSKILALTTDLNIDKYNIDVDSPFTSVHIHINVLEYTPVQVWTAITAYWLFEDAFMSQCGEDRKGNQYCLRMKDAEGVIQEAIRDLGCELPFVNLRTRDNIRYCGQNIKSVAERGSIEYRGMRGTLDPFIIDKWSTILYELVDKSKNFANPAALLDFYWKHGAGSTLHNLCSYGTYLALTRDCPKLGDLSFESALCLCDIAYGTVEWDVWAAQIEKKFEEKKGQDKKLASNAPVVVPFARMLFDEENFIW